MLKRPENEGFSWEDAPKQYWYPIWSSIPIFIFAIEYNQNQDRAE